MVLNIDAPDSHSSQKRGTQPTAVNQSGPCAPFVFLGLDCSNAHELNLAPQPVLEGGGAMRYRAWLSLHIPCSISRYSFVLFLSLSFTLTTTGFTALSLTLSS